MKFATFIEAAAGHADAGRAWIASAYITQIRTAAPTLRGCVYRLCRPSPGTYFDAFDALIESWFSASEDFRREMRPLEQQLEQHGMRYASYHVVPRLQLDPRIAEAGPDGARPEITSICAIRWKQGLSRQVTSDSYNRHAAIALRAQGAITKYEQNIVEEVISWSDGIVPMDAYADFSHPTVEACRTGLLASREERQDTAGYISVGRFSYLADARPVPRGAGSRLDRHQGC